MVQPTERTGETEESDAAPTRAAGGVTPFSLLERRKNKHQSV